MSTETINTIDQSFDNQIDFYRALRDMVWEYRNIADTLIKDAELLIEYKEFAWRSLRELKNVQVYNTQLSIMLKTMMDEVFFFDSDVKRSRVIDYLNEKVEDVLKTQEIFNYQRSIAHSGDETDILSEKLRAIDEFHEFLSKLIAVFAHYGKQFYNLAANPHKTDDNMHFGHYVGEIITYRIGKSVYVGRLCAYYPATKKYRAHFGVDVDINGRNGGAVAFPDGKFAVYGRDGNEAAYGIWESPKKWEDR